MKNMYVVKQNEGILLNANENFRNLKKEIIDEIVQEISTLSFHRYPDDEMLSLLEAYGEYVNLPSSQILAGNGSDELLGLLIGLNISKGKNLYTMTPDFSMYDYYVSMHDGEIVKYENKAEDIFDVDAFIAYGKEKKVDLILFSNPNNPTGKIISEEEICKIVEAFKDIVVIVDEAYGEFSEVSMISYVNTYENLLVTRTLSKAFASAGIRCGFLMGSKSLMNKIRPYKVPYNVNSLTQIAAKIILKHTEEMKKDVVEVKKERDALYEEYTKLNREDLILYPSNANYLYGKSLNKEKLLNAFAKENIQIRNYQENDFRITIGSKEENKKVLSILKNF